MFYLCKNIFLIKKYSLIICINFNFYTNWKMFVFLILFFINSINEIYSSYILLPFKTEKQNNNYIESKYDINLHTYIEIGVPKRKLKIYFRDEFFSFFISNKDITYNEEETKEIKIPYKYVKKYIYDLYDNKLSFTYKNISDYKNFFIDIYYRKGYLSTETFYFNTSNQIKRFNNLNFVLINKIKPEKSLISGAIGLLVDEYSLEGAQSFAKMLVKKNVTSLCLWSKIYDNDNNGIFIFGDYPHSFYNNKFFEDQYIETNIKLNTYKQKWNIDFKEIFFEIKNNNSNDNDVYTIYLNKTLYGELRHNFGLIIGTVEYHNLIENAFFKSYIKNNICHKKIILINDFNDNKVNYTYYYCYNVESFLKEEFPKLFLKQRELNYTFELDENDLFTLFDDKWYFMIIFEGEETKNQMHKWFFGEPLLKKYIFVFDPINYKIGFYNPNIFTENPKRTNKISELKDKKIYIFIIATLIIIIVFSLIFHKRKKFCFYAENKAQPYTELQSLSIQKK